MLCRMSIKLAVQWPSRQVSPLPIVIIFEANTTERQSLTHLSWYLNYTWISSITIVWSFPTRIICLAFSVACSSVRGPDASGRQGVSSGRHSPTWNASELIMFFFGAGSEEFQSLPRRRHARQTSPAQSRKPKTFGRPGLSRGSAAQTYFWS